MGERVPPLRNRSGFIISGRKTDCARQKICPPAFVGVMQEFWKKGVFVLRNNAAKITSRPSPCMKSSAFLPSMRKVRRMRFDLCKKRIEVAVFEIFFELSSFPYLRGGESHRFLKYLSRHSSINLSAIPLVGDCGFSFSSGGGSFFFSSSKGGAFPFGASLGGAFFGGGGFSQGDFWKSANISENLDRSFKNFSISSESFSLHMIGFTLSGKFGFCER